jgi:hypothetical protein
MRKAFRSPFFWATLITGAVIVTVLCAIALGWFLNQAFDFTPEGFYKQDVDMADAWDSFPVADNPPFDGEWLLNDRPITIINGEGETGNYYIRIIDSVSEINGVIYDHSDIPNVLYCIPQCVYDALVPNGDGSYHDVHGNILLERP